MSLNRVELARALAAEIAGVAGVSRLGGGDGVQAATQFPYGKVDGVSVTEARIEARVVADRLPVTEVAQRVHKAAGLVLLAAGDTRPVRVVITDVDVESLDHAGRS